MNKFTILMFFMLLGGWLIAAEEPDTDARTAISKEINLRSAPDKVISWIEKNKNVIQDESGFDSVKNMGNGKYKITKDTPKGTFIWIIKETTEKKDGKCYFRSTLIESIEGGIVYSNSEIIVSSNGKGSHVEINAKVGVNNPRVRSPQLKIDTNMHLNRLKRLIEENVN